MIVDYCLIAVELAVLDPFLTLKQRRELGF